MRKVPYDRRADTRSGCWLFSCLILGFVGCLWAGCYSLGAGVAVLVGAVVLGLIPLIVLSFFMEGYPVAAPPREEKSPGERTGTDIWDAGRKTCMYTAWAIILACLVTGRKNRR